MTEHRERAISAKTLPRDFVSRVLDVIEHDVVPETYKTVREGNRVFGAAILRKSDLSVVVSNTNHASECPLWHGEIYTIKKFFELPAASRPAPRDCYFIATHEPCSLCLSGVTWSNFDNFFYLFTYEDTRDAFNIPYDIQIMQAVYQVPDPGHKVSAGRELYNRSNDFFVSFPMRDLIDAEPDGDKRDNYRRRVHHLREVYEDLTKISEAHLDGAIPI